jgi:SAM-dependent methyltransferase
MLDIARRRAREIGISGGEYRLVDAADIDLPADSVERVICRFGYMFVPDPGSALAETRRVLRPGGRLALAVWAGPEHNPYFTLLMATLAELGHAPPVDPAAAGPLSLGDADRLAGLLAGAGFTDVVIEPVPVAFGFDDIVEYVALSEEVAGPIMAILPGLTPDQRAEVIAKVEAAAAPFRAGPGYEFPGVALCAQAVSP